MLTIKLTTAEYTILSLFRFEVNRSVYNPDLNLSGKDYGSAVRSLKQRGFLVSTRTPLRLTKRGKSFIHKMSTYPPNPEPIAFTLSQFFLVGPGTSTRVEDGHIYVVCGSNEYEIILAVRDTGDEEEALRAISDLSLAQGDCLEEGGQLSASCNAGMF